MTLSLKKYKNEIKNSNQSSESSLHLRMGSTVMLKTVGAEGARGYGSGVWFRVQALQQQKSMARQSMVPPIMAQGEVKIQWLSIPS